MRVLIERRKWGAPPGSAYSPGNGVRRLPQKVIFHKVGDETGILDMEERMKSGDMKLTSCLAGLLVFLLGLTREFPENVYCIQGL